MAQNRTFRFQVGETVMAAVKTGPEQTITYHPGTIVGAHYTSTEPIYDVHIPDLYPKGSLGYGNPQASVPLDESVLQARPERSARTGKIQIVAGTTPRAQKVADQLAQAIQQKYGRATQPETKALQDAAASAKNQAPELEAGD